MTTEIRTLFGFTSPKNHLGLPADLRAVMYRPRIIAVLGEAYRHVSNQAEAANVFARISTLQLAPETDFLNRILLPSGKSMQQLIGRCCYLPARIFVSTRVFPRSMTYHPALMRALWECVLALRRLDELHQVEGMYNLFLSCLFIGAHAAWGLPERPKYVAEIGRVAGLLHLSAWSDVQPR